jgi:hypothetical protein
MATRDRRHAKVQLRPRLWRPPGWREGRGGDHGWGRFGTLLCVRAHALSETAILVRGKNRVMAKQHPPVMAVTLAETIDRGLSIPLAPATRLEFEALSSTLLAED